MSCPSGYRENLTSLEQETFPPVQNSPFLAFCNGELSILKDQVFLVVEL